MVHTDAAKLGLGIRNWRQYADLPTVDLSIDFDFFVREDPDWDLGHSEHPEVRGTYTDTIWDVRYLQLDLHALTDLRTYADFMPTQLQLALSTKGVALVPQALRYVGFADSHEYAYNLFTLHDDPVAPVVLNIDAHHDMWEPGPHPMCANWATWLHDYKAPGSHFIHAYPSWLQDPGAPVRPMEQVQWSKWPGLGTPHRVRRIFLCRSGAWVPPHLDPDFFALADLLRRFGRTKWYEQFKPRRAPTAREAARTRRQIAEALQR